MAGQYEILPCPFCGNGEINCMYFPGAWSEKHSGRNSLGSGKYVNKSSEVWIIKSGCNNCGKSQEEVEVELKKKNVI